MQEKTNQKANFFQNLEHLITESGLKRAQVADAVGVHQVSFYRYFSAQRLPKRAILEKIAAFFNVEVSALLTQDLTKKQTEQQVPPAIPPLPVDSSNEEFAIYVHQRTAELQRIINQFAADILEKYNQCKK